MRDILKARMYNFNVSEIKYLPGLECEPAEQSFLCDEFLWSKLLKNKIVLQVTTYNYCNPSIHGLKLYMLLTPRKYF